LNINTEELSRYVAKVVPVNETTDSKLSIFKIGKSECDINNEVLLTVSCPIFPSILIAKNLITGSLKNRSIDNLETQKKSISMKNSQFFDYLLYAKPK
jgi:hypothetical protein